MTPRHPRERGPLRAPFRAFLLAAAVGALAALPPARALHAQGGAAAADTLPAEALVEVRLLDGTALYGRIAEETAETITIVTSGGSRLTVRREQVASMRAARGRIVNGEFWGEDPHATRLFFGPTARSLNAGEGYFGVFELFFPFLAYAPTDRVTLAGGTPIVPGAIGEVLYLAPKVEVIRTGRASFAVGGLGVWGTGDLSESVGLLYGVGTLGSPDAALTLGAAFPFYTGGDDDDDDWVSEKPFLMLGGEKRIGRRTKLISENYLAPGGDGTALSGGIRFFGERLSADAGIIGWVDGDNAECCFPLVNFVYSFGGRR